MTSDTIPTPPTPPTSGPDGDADLVTPASPAPEGLAGAIGRLENLLFAPASVASMAVYRIAFGLMLFGWTASLALDLGPFFSDNGINPSAIGGWSWSIFEAVDSDGFILAAWILLLLTSVAITLGWRTRAVAVLGWVLLLSLQRRDVWVLNSGDLLVRHLGFYLMLMPSGLALSLDQRRAGGRPFVDWPAVAQWPLYLVRVQMSAIYIFTVWAKLPGATWGDGTAVVYAVRLLDHARFQIPWAITDNLLIANLLTYGTLAIEMSLGVLIWNRKLRPWVLLAGLALHVGIDLTLTVGFFSLAIYVGYVAWLPPEWTEAGLDRVRSRLGSGRRAERVGQAA